MAYEGFVLNGLDLNDGTNFTIDGDSFSFSPAQPKAQWASNSASDGDALVGEPHYGPAFFDFSVRVEPQASMTAALAKVGELMDALSSCKRTEGGAAAEWKPAGSETVYTWQALLGEVADLPITVSGELAGWFIDSPVVRVKLTCDSAGETEEEVVYEATESGAEPQQVAYVENIGGDLPAKARAILTDKATQSRRYAEYGRDVVTSKEGNPATILTAASLVITNFSGTSTTRSGAYSEEKVKRATAVSQPTVMCGTGVIKHIGSFKVYARVYAASEAARFRISYRNGEGPLVPLAFVQPPVIENFSRIYLGEVTLDEAQLGEQKSEIRVEPKSSTGVPIEVDLNYLELIPSTKGSARVRGEANNNPSKLLAYDTFLQTEGALAGKAAPLGGNWAGAGDAVDFTVIAASDYVRRTEKSDADLNTGRYALVGAEEPTSCQVSADVTCAAVPVGVTSNEANRLGVVARYTSTEKWLMAVLTAQGAAGTAIWTLYVLKRESAGAATVLDSAQVTTTVGAALSSRTITLRVGSDGSWSADVTGLASGLSGQDSALATGGALAKGKGGIYDAWVPSEAPTRTIDSFSLLSAEPANTVLYSGKTAEFRHDGFLRQDSTGAYYGELPLRGANLYLEPAGDSGAINRLVFVLRRNDVETEADTNVTDKTSLQVFARSRYLVPR